MEFNGQRMVLDYTLDSALGQYRPPAAAYCGGPAPPPPRPPTRSVGVGQGQGFGLSSLANAAGRMLFGMFSKDTQTDPPEPPPPQPPAPVPPKPAPAPRGPPPPPPPLLKRRTPSLQAPKAPEPPEEETKPKKFNPFTASASSKIKDGNWRPFAPDAFVSKYEELSKGIQEKWDAWVKQTGDPAIFFMNSKIAFQNWLEKQQADAEVADAHVHQGRQDDNRIAYLERIKRGEDVPVEERLPADRFVTPYMLSNKDHYEFLMKGPVSGDWIASWAKDEARYVRNNGPYVVPGAGQNVMGKQRRARPGAQRKPVSKKARTPAKTPARKCRARRPIVSPLSVYAKY